MPEKGREKLGLSRASAVTISLPQGRLLIQSEIFAIGYQRGAESVKVAEWYGYGLLTGLFGFSQ